jgi:hypothetical protein
MHKVETETNLTESVRMSTAGKSSKWEREESTKYAKITTLAVAPRSVSCLRIGRPTLNMAI